MEESGEKKQVPILIFATITLAMLACGSNSSTRTEASPSTTSSILNAGDEMPASSVDSSSQRDEDTSSGRANEQVEESVESDKTKEAKQGLAAVITGAQLYLVEHPQECPSVSQIIESKFLRPNFPLQDVWGNNYVINCTKEKVLVTSVGPDGKIDSEDDIHWEADR